MRIAVVIVLLFIGATNAMAAFGFITGGYIVPTAQQGKLLLANGSSFLLLTDGTSKLCLAGGC